MDFHLIINNFLIIVQGLDETLILIFLSLIIGFFISIPFSLARVSSIKILGPQILKHALPGLGNVWQITLKDTALISVTGLVEIMRQSRIAANVTHSPLTFYLTAAVLYLILTTFSSKAFNKLEDYSNKNQVTA